MKAGQLRDRITILKREITQKPHVGEEYSWKDFITVRATIKFASGKIEETNMEYAHNQVNKVTIYYRSAIKREMRVKYNNEIYQINSINPDQSHNMMTLTIELVNE